MTLGLKTIILLAAVITLSILAQFVIIARSVLPGLEATERQVTAQRLSQGLALLAEEERELAERMADWAAAPATVAYLRDPGEDYPLEDLVYESLLAGDFDLFALYDNQGNLLWGAIPEGTGADGPARAEAMDRLLREGLDARLLRADKPTTGLVELGGRGLYLAARPVIDRELGASANGRLIMARLLSEGLLARLVQRLDAPFTVSPVSEKKRQEIATAFSRLPDETPFIMSPEQGPLDTAQAVMRDLSGRPVLLVEVPSPRHLFDSGRQGLQNALTAVLVVAGGMFFVLLFGLQAVVLRPISKLAREVASLSMKGPGTRLKSRRKDEIGIIAREFDDLLDRLERDDAPAPAPPPAGDGDVESETIRRVRRLLEE